MYHHQNLNERRDGTCGTILKHGRAWWGKLRWEWHIGKSTPGAYIRKGDGGGLHFHIGLLFSFYLTIGGLFRPSQRDRELSIRFMDGCIWMRFWGDPNDSQYDRQASLRWRDWLLGRQKYSCVTKEERAVVIPMPEGCYPATVKMQQATWTRARWFSFSFLRADVDIPEGIPFQGKGENSWDCGDDAMYGSSFPASSVEEAIGKVVTSALKDRKRYGETKASRGVVVLAAAAA